MTTQIGSSQPQPVAQSTGLPWSNEAAVWNAIKAEQGFLLAYVQWAAQQTDAPLAYHVGAGLSLLASVFPSTITLPGLPGNEVPGNLFTILVGRQGIERKSTALSMARRLLAESDPTRIGTLDGSVEGLIDSLPEQPQQTVFISDLGVFFEQTKARSGGNIYANVKMRLLDLFDSEPIFRRLSKNVSKDGSASKRHTVRCDNPRVSLLGGINPALVESSVERNDWENGLMSRMVILWAHKERMTFRSHPDPARRKWLKSFLTNACVTPGVRYGACMGLDAHAQAQWEGWTAAVEASTPAGRQTRVVGPQARAPYLAARIAMLLEWGRGSGFPPDAQGTGQPWYIKQDTLAIAIAIATISYQSALTLAASSDATQAVRLRRTVMDCIPEATWVPFSDVLRQSTLLKRQCKEVLETLVAERTLTTSIATGVNGMESSYFRNPNVQSTVMITVPQAIAIPTGLAPIHLQPAPMVPVAARSKTGWTITIGNGRDGPLPPDMIPMPDLGDPDAKDDDEYAPLSSIAKAIIAGEEAADRTAARHAAAAQSAKPS